LVEFPSALDAVRCAYDIQRAIRELDFSLPEDRRIQLRVGIHLGDIVESQGDISGDAVNVASRIEPLAEDGGVCLTRQVYDHVRNKFELPMTSLGTRPLKNVGTPLEVYKIVMPWSDVKTPSAGPLDTKRVAVLPFANMSPDPADEYFADGMTEELISTVSKIEQVEVISRTSVMQFKKSPKAIKEVSRELDAGTVLEGSVRKSGSKLRVTVQMIDAARDRHLWAESYDRDLQDVFAIQSDIAKQVAEALRLRILPEESEKLDRRPTADTAAYVLYLKGRFYWNERTKEGIQTAIEYFTNATKIDPNYARAYAGLADCYSILENWGYMPPAEAGPKRDMYVARALELDDSLAEAHVAKATILTSKEWNFPEAEKEYKRAIELDPNYATAHHFYGNGLLGPQGRLEEAISELKEAKRLDPLSLMISANLGDRYLEAGMIEEAEKQYRSILDGAPNFSYAHFALGGALTKQSRFEEAISEIQKGVELEPILGKINLIYPYALTGRKGDAERLLDELERESEQTYVTNVDFAIANAAVGRDEKAFEFLQKAAAERSNRLWINLSAPEFEHLRSDPRFQKLLSIVGRGKNASK
jgi:adenylate cyclase